ARSYSDTPAVLREPAVTGAEAGAAIGSVRCAEPRGVARTHLQLQDRQRLHWPPAGAAIFLVTRPDPRGVARAACSKGRQMVTSAVAGHPPSWYLIRICPELLGQAAAPVPPPITSAASGSPHSWCPSGSAPAAQAGLQRLHVSWPDSKEY
ncbi:hypothetical protein AAXB25_34775, partial [Paenibacillus lautus]|uniref:hypothetical protein n=1 Tax=Paenibacillus lautus TaxID=1401 RepID=UPI003D2B834D